MVDNDGIPNDARSREDEYFRRKDRELIEKMRLASLASETRRELESKTGLTDPVLLQELEALGFTPETIALLPLVPIVQVAWAEGGVTAEERELISQLAGERGITPESAAGRQLGEWLAHQPPTEVFTRATRLIRAMLDTPAAERNTMQAEDLLQHCEAIAAASGGVLGFRKVSARERELLAQIAAELESR